MTMSGQGRSTGTTSGAARPRRRGGPRGARTLARAGQGRARRGAPGAGRRPPAPAFGVGDDRPDGLLDRLRALRGRDPFRPPGRQARRLHAGPRHAAGLARAWSTSTARCSRSSTSPRPSGSAAAAGDDAFVVVLGAGRDEVGVAADAVHEVRSIRAPTCSTRRRAWRGSAIPCSAGSPPTPSSCSTAGRCWPTTASSSIRARTRGVREGRMTGEK